MVDGRQENVVSLKKCIVDFQRSNDVLQAKLEVLQTQNWDLLVSRSDTSWGLVEALRIILQVSRRDFEWWAKVDSHCFTQLLGCSCIQGRLDCFMWYC
jgi:hypothetical protein